MLVFVLVIAAAAAGLPPLLRGSRQTSPPPVQLRPGCHPRHPHRRYRHHCHHSRPHPPRQATLVRWTIVYLYLVMTAKIGLVMLAGRAAVAAAPIADQAAVVLPALLFLQVTVLLVVAAGIRPQHHLLMMNLAMVAGSLCPYVTMIVDPPLRPQEYHD